MRWPAASCDSNANVREMAPGLADGHRSSLAIDALSTALRGDAAFRFEHCRLGPRTWAAGHRGAASRLALSDASVEGAPTRRLGARQR